MNRPPLGQVLLDARTHAHLSQRDVARRLGRAHSYVAKIESGARRVEVTEFLQIAQALGLEPGALLGQLAAISKATKSEQEIVK